MRVGFTESKKSSLTGGSFFFLLEQSTTYTDTRKRMFKEKDGIVTID